MEAQVKIYLSIAIALIIVWLLSLILIFYKILNKKIFKLHLGEKLFFWPSTLIIIYLILLIYLSHLSLPATNYSIMKNNIPNYIENIIFINGLNVSRSTYSDEGIDTYKINNTMIQFINSPSKDPVLNIKYYPRLTYEDKKVHYIYKEGNLLIDSILNDNILIPQKTYINIKLSKEKFENVELIENNSNKITKDYSILYEDNNYHMLEHYSLENESLRFIVRDDDHIYLLYKNKFIYQVDRNYKWSKLYTSSLTRPPFKYKWGILNIQIFNNKLYIMEYVFYPEILCRYQNITINLLFFKRALFMKILDLKTKKIIRKYIMPENIEQLKTQAYCEYPFTVLEDDVIMVGGNYIINFKNMEIVDLNLNNILPKDFNKAYATDFCIIKREEQ